MKTIKFFSLLVLVAASADGVMGAADCPLPPTSRTTKETLTKRRADTA
jgi:hypothetical protein